MGEFFSLHIGSLSLRNHVFDCECLGVRAFFVDLSSNKLMKKQATNKQVFSHKEVTEYFPPVTTLCVDGRKQRGWNEEFVFLEPPRNVVQRDVYLVFELVDFLHSSNGCKLPKILAWGFLSMEAYQNFGKTRWVQLFLFPNIDQKFPDYNLSTLLKERVSALVCLSVVLFNNRSTRNPLEEPVFIDKQDVVEEEDFEEPPVPIPKKLRAQIYCGDKGIYALKYSLDGSILAVAVQQRGYSEVQIYYSHNLYFVTKFVAHHDIIYEIAFSHDGKYILTVSSDHFAKVWQEDSEKGYTLASSFLCATFLYSGVFHPHDSTLVAVGTNDGTVLLWNHEQHQFVFEYNLHKCRINTICFSPTGKRLYTGDAYGKIGVIDYMDKEPFFKPDKLISEYEIGDTAIVNLQMMNDYLLVVRTQDNIIRVLDGKQLIVIRRYLGGRCEYFKMNTAVSHDKSYLIAGNETGGVNIWTARKGKIVSVADWVKLFHYPVTSVEWNPVLNQVAFGSFGAGEPLMVFDEETPSRDDDDQSDDATLLESEVSEYTISLLETDDENLT